MAQHSVDLDNHNVQAIDGAAVVKGRPAGLVARGEQGAPFRDHGRAQTLEQLDGTAPSSRGARAESSG
jgi:hypothetical protein